MHLYMVLNIILPNEEFLLTRPSETQYSIIVHDENEYELFLCKWDSRAKQKDGVVRAWRKKINFAPGTKNNLHEPLLEP